MQIGEAARRAGVNVQTLRYYERRGLLPRPVRRPSGYREYVPDTVRVVRFIKRAQELGFSLEDAAELVRLREAPARNRLVARQIAERKIVDIATRIRDLKAMQRVLKELVTACECAGNHRCPIIETLDSNMGGDARGA